MKNLRIEGRIFTWYESQKFKKTKARSKKRFYKKDAFTKKVQRRRNGLLKLIYSLEKNPKWFITLIYPKKYSETKTSERIKRDLDRLSTRIRRDYRKSWFVYSIEWSPKSKLHIHLAGKLESVRRGFQHKLPNWWANIISSRQANLSRVDFLPTLEDSKAAIGYLSKNEKKARLPKAIKLLKKQYTHGIVNAGNLPVSKAKSYKISNKNFYQISERLICEDLGAEYRSSARNKQKNKLAYSHPGFHILNNPGKIKAFLREKAEEVHE